MSTPVKLGPTGHVDAPRATPAVAGLLSLANQPPSDPDTRWELGYAYRPELPARFVRARSSVTATIGDNQSLVDYSGIISTIPVLYEVEDQVSSFDFRAEDYNARVTRLVDAYSSRFIERELWTGEIAAVDHLPNRVLAHPDAIDLTPGTAPHPQLAVAILMQELVDSGFGEGMIHTSKFVGIQLPDAWRNADTLNEFGFVVVSGAGYPGTGPDGTGKNWMYATATVNVRLGDIDVIPDTFSAAVTKATNTVNLYGQRLAAADFAGPVFACQVASL